MKSIRQNFKDWPLIMISIGLVTFLELVKVIRTHSRLAFFDVGFYYPFFYL